MKIYEGFTLLELLTVIGDHGYLGSIIVPDFVIMQKRVRFREDGQKVLDILSEARSNALANRKCKNEQDSAKWTVIFKKGSDRFELYCQDTDGNAEKQQSQANFLLTPNVTTIYFIGGEDSSWTSDDYLGVSYWSGTGQNRIESFPFEDGFTEENKNANLSPWADRFSGIRRKGLRIILEWAEFHETVVICLNSIAGFPRYGLDTKNNSCPE